MSLAFTSRRGTLEIRWLTYALLRDNVAHHLERDDASGFPQLHEVARALGGAPVRVPAAAFNRELAQVRERLLGLGIEQLALSARTRSILLLQWPSADLGNPASEVVGPLAVLGDIVVGARVLGEVFGAMVEELLAPSADAQPGDEIEISDH